MIQQALEKWTAELKEKEARIEHLEARLAALERLVKNMPYLTAAPEPIQ